MAKINFQDGGDINDYLDTDVKPKKKSSNNKEFHPKDPDRSQFEQAQSSVLKRVHDEEKREELERQKKEKEDSLKKYNPNENFYRRINDEKIKNFAKNNKRTKYNQQRIEILKAEIEQYKKIGNKEAIKLCKEELQKLQNESKFIAKKLKPKSKEDIKNNNSILSTDELIKEKKLKEKALKRAVTEEEIETITDELESINEQIENTETHNVLVSEKKVLNKELRDIKEQIKLEKVSPILSVLDETLSGLNSIEKYISNIDDNDVADLDDFLNNQNDSYIDDKNIDSLSDEDDLDDFDFDEDGNIYESKDYYISTIKALPIKERLPILIRLISKRTGKDIYSIESLINDKKTSVIKKLLQNSENKELIEELESQKSEIQSNINKINSQINGSENIIDIIFDFLDYDEKNEMEQYQSKELLMASSASYISNLATNICNKNSVSDNQVIKDAIATAYCFAWSKVDDFFKARENGEYLNWNQFIFKNIAQETTRFIYEWKASGTISGTSIQSNSYKRKNRYKALLQPFIDNGMVKNENSVPQYIENLIWDAVDKEEYSVDFNTITNASETEAIVGGDDGYRDGYDNLESASNRDNASEIELKLEHETLIKSISEFLNLFKIEVKTKPDGTVISKTKSKYFTPLECFLFKYKFGFITGIGKSGQVKNPSAQEIMIAANEFMKKTGIRLPKGGLFTMDAKGESNLSHMMTRIFGNRTAYDLNQKKLKYYEQGLISKKPGEKELIEGKIHKILKEYPEFAKAFKHLLQDMAANSYSVILSNQNNDELNNTFDTVAFELMSDDETVKNNSIDLSLVLGDDETSDDDLSLWSEMIDYTNKV